MQTFLPYPDFDQSVRCLDWRRLGKQRVESRQIYKALFFGNGAPGFAPSRWRNHPAVLMWAGYEEALLLYSNICIKEWIRRGKNNNMILVGIDHSPAMPQWFGDEEFHASHRSNLLRKDAEFYGKFGWDESDDLPYVWPVRKGCVVSGQ